MTPAVNEPVPPIGGSVAGMPLHVVHDDIIARLEALDMRVIGVEGSMLEQMQAILAALNRLVDVLDAFAAR